MKYPFINNFSFRRYLISLLIAISVLFFILFNFTIWEGVRNRISSTQHSVKLMMSSILEESIKDTQFLSRKVDHNLYRIYMNNENLYNQLRILNSKGMEVFRLNKFKDKVVQAKASELQDKSNRGYFKEMLLTPAREVYISKIDYNVEGSITYKDQITFRVAKKINDNNYLILNINSAYIQGKIQQLPLLQFSVEELPERAGLRAFLQGEINILINYNESNLLSQFSNINQQPWNLWLIIDAGAEKQKTLFSIFALSAVIFILALLNRFLSEREKKIFRMNSLMDKAFNDSLIYSTTDSRGKINFVNDKFIQISEYNKEELIGKDHRLINSEFHPSEFFTEMWSTISSGRVWTGKIRNRKKSGGYYWVYSIIIPIMDEKNKIEGYSALRFDITREIELENKMQLYRDQSSANVNKMSASLVHQFSTPISIIHSSTEIIEMLLEQEIKKNKDLIEQISNIKTTTSRMVSLMNLFRQLGRRSSLRPTNSSYANLVDVINDSLAMCNSNIVANGVQVHPIDQELQCLVRGDHILLIQVFINLINNSIQAVSDLEQRWIEITLLAKNKNEISILFTDSGPGIKPEVSAQLFESFHTTKDLSVGTGLGLALSRDVLKFYGGNILYVGSREHTSFQIVLKNGEDLWSQQSS